MLDLCHIMLLPRHLEGDFAYFSAAATGDADRIARSAAQLHSLCWCCIGACHVLCSQDLTKVLNTAAVAQHQHMMLGFCLLMYMHSNLRYECTTHYRTRTSTQFLVSVGRCTPVMRLETKTCALCAMNRVCPLGVKAMSLTVEPSLQAWTRRLGCQSRNLVSCTTSAG